MEKKPQWSHSSNISIYWFIFKSFMSLVSTPVIDYFNPFSWGLLNFFSPQRATNIFLPLWLIIYNSLEHSFHLAVILWGWATGYRISRSFKVVRYHCSVTNITITAVWSKTETKIEPHRFHWFKCIPVFLGPDFFFLPYCATRLTIKQIQNNWHMQTESNRFQFFFSCLAMT